MSVETRVERAWAELDAAAFHGSVVRWWTPLDNHEPVYRAQGSGYGVRYARYDGTPGFTFWPGEEIKEARRAVYVLDDGMTAVPYYVCGWKKDGPGVFLQPLPTNPGGKRRPDNGQVIDFGDWALGPRRMYHLKISAMD